MVFSNGGKLYDFCSGGTNSMKHLLARYEAEGQAIKGDGHDSELPLQCTKSRTYKEVIQMVDRLDEENNTEELSLADMTQIEEELDAALMQTRSIKTQLQMEYISTLQQKEKNLIQEKEEITQQIASGKHMYTAVDDGGGGLNNIIVNHKDSPQHVTLPLFNT
ncbi:hypothetical protein L1887_11620 [Cichorium endivia]|nr:hypothetical protein L1887_11620 [Cichorium endivia]